MMAPISEDRLLSILTAGRIADSQLRAIGQEVDQAARAFERAQFSMQRELSDVRAGKREPSPEVVENVNRAKAALEAVKGERDRISAILIPRLALARNCERYARERGIKVANGLSQLPEGATSYGR